MIPVSEEFKSAMTQSVKEVRASMECGEISITDENNLISVKISCETGLCKTAMRKLEAKYLGTQNLLGKRVTVGYDVRLENGGYEHLSYGSFLVTEMTTSKDKETTTIVGYDKMVDAMTQYDAKKMEIEYPVRLIDYTRELCGKCGLELGQPLFGKDVGVAELSGVGEYTLENALETSPEIVVEGVSVQSLAPVPTAPCEIESVSNFDITVNDNPNMLPLLHDLCALPSGVRDERGYGYDIQRVRRRIIDPLSGTWKIEAVRENTTLFYVYGLFTDMAFKGNDTDIYCSHFVANHVYSKDEVGIYLYGNEYKIVYISVPKSIATTVDEFKQWCTTNLITVQYELAEPIVTKMDDDINLFAGENTVSITSDVTPHSVSFKYYTSQYPYNAMNDWPVELELWGNINGITYRDILTQIAQVTGSVGMIGADDKLYFKELTETGETLTYDNLFKLKLEEQYGEINSVVLSRSPSEDNIYYRDEASIQTNGLTELKIENNEIVDKNRDDAIVSIFDVVKGIKYYPFDATTEGLGWYEIGDSLTIIDENETPFATTVLGLSISIDGGFHETLKATAESKTQTQYQYATSIEKRIKNTEIIVNKQEQYIQQKVSDMEERDGVINEKFTQIYQDIDNIVNSVQNSGGNNLLKNSVMFSHENNVPVNWELEGEGSISIQSDTEALSNGGLSGHGFTLKNMIARQKVSVKAYDGVNATYYTFSVKIKKSAAGSCYVRLYNSNEDHYVTPTLGVGDTSFYGDYEIKELLPMDNHYIVEFYGSGDSDATFTDAMFAVGNYKSQWTQANGEVMNTQVNINLDGITVKSSVYLGDYTVVSPLEFAGYSKINGTITKVFSLNKDTTEVKKLKVEDEVKMAPIKIVPITSGDMQGWAFVPITQEGGV